MTTPAWPSTLPQAFLKDGFQHQLGDGRLRSPTDTGPGKERRRFSAVVDLVTARALMDDDQWDAFLDFIKTDIGGGTLAFTAPPPWGGSGDDVLVKLGEKMPARAPSDVPGKWLVSIDLEIMP